MVVQGAVTTPLGGTRETEALGQLVAGGVRGVAVAFSTLFMMVLYESQRARKDPSLYPVAGLAPAPAPPQAPPGWPPESR